MLGVELKVYMGVGGGDRATVVLVGRQGMETVITGMSTGGIASDAGSSRALA